MLVDNFSVLIPLYHKDDPASFDLALSSVIRDQTVKPTEVVVVVDGRINDELEAVLSRWESECDLIRSIRMVENVGISLALQEGLRHCQYEYIMRMDSDDICYPRRFEVQMQYMLNNPDVTMISSSVEQFDFSMKEKVGERLLPSHSGDVRKFARFRTPVNHMAVCFRKEQVVGAGGYPDTRYPFEDWWMCLRCIAAGLKVENVSEYLVAVRTGEAFYARRSGLDYVKMEVKALCAMRREGVMSDVDFLINLAIRVPVRLLPTFAVKKMYRRFLANGRP